MTPKSPLTTSKVVSGLFSYFYRRNARTVCIVCPRHGNDVPAPW